MTWRYLTWRALPNEKERVQGAASPISFFNTLRACRCSVLSWKGRDKRGGKHRFSVILSANRSVSWLVDDTVSMVSHNDAKLLFIYNAHMGLLWMLAQLCDYSLKRRSTHAHKCVYKSGTEGKHATCDIVRNAADSPHLLRLPP